MDKRFLWMHEIAFFNYIAFPLIKLAAVLSCAEQLLKCLFDCCLLLGFNWDNENAFQASAKPKTFFYGCICLPSLIIFYSNEFYDSVFNVILVNGLFEYEQQKYYLSNNIELWHDLLSCSQVITSWSLSQVKKRNQQYSRKIFLN